MRGAQARTQVRSCSSMSWQGIAARAAPTGAAPALVGSGACREALSAMQTTTEPLGAVVVSGWPAPWHACRGFRTIVLHPYMAQRSTHSGACSFLSACLPRTSTHRCAVIDLRAGLQRGPSAVVVAVIGLLAPGAPERGVVPVWSMVGTVPVCPPGDCMVPARKPVCGSRQAATAPLTIPRGCHAIKAACPDESVRVSHCRENPHEYVVRPRFCRC